MNTITVIGNVGRKPEMTYTPAGNAVTRFTVADNPPKRNGQAQEAQWFNCVAFGKVGELLNQYVDKGTQLYVQGTLSTRTYTARDGSKGFALDILIEKFHLIGGKPGDASAGDTGADSGEHSAVPMDPATGLPKDFPF